MKDLQIKKLYYSISEVSKMLGLEQYVLRYWETEFEQLRPQKNRAGNRIYTEKDIEIVKMIKRLTREDRYTIEGARQVMTSMMLENGGVLKEEHLDAKLSQAAAAAAVAPAMVAVPADEPPLADTLRALRATLAELRGRL
jgi:DNA-binding transcriptional MerR regulator